MATTSAFFNIQKLKKLADWNLLLFLILFMNVKLEVKVLAIVLVYSLQSNFKFGFSFKGSRLPLFYPAVILIAIINWVIGSNYSLRYDFVLLTGISFWLMCILAMHQVKLSVEKNDAETINKTIILFFVLNAAFSLVNFAIIAIRSGDLNPYTFQGEHQKYFIGTGDYIRGLTFDTSITNAVLNAFGVIYFITKRNTPMVLVCMAIMLLTGSNFTNLILVLVLVVLLIFKSSRDQKSLILLCTMLLVVFMAKISPQNSTYVLDDIKRVFHLNKKPKPAPARPRLYLPITLMPDSVLTADEKRWKIAQRYIDSMYVVNHPELLKPNKKAIVVTKPIPTVGYGRPYIPKANINNMPYQHVIDTSVYQKHLLAFIDTHKKDLPIVGQDNYKLSFMPGKALTILQTTKFLQQHPFKFITGAGIGNFSSKLAFRATALNIAGGYPQRYSYFNPDFLSNHLDIYLTYFSKKTDVHSLANNPNSAYDQLLAEYGLLGVLAFICWYLGYFLKHYKILTYGLPILLVLIAALSVEYWFEQLSILLFFELLLLLDIKEASAKNILTYAN